MLGKSAMSKYKSVSLLFARGRYYGAERAIRWNLPRISSNYYYCVLLFVCGDIRDHEVFNACCDEYIYLCVHSHNSKTTRPKLTKFCARCLWPWLGLPMTASRYVMYFRFSG